jgi:hypothetical protein
MTMECDMFRGKEKCKEGLNLKERDHLEDLDINGRIMWKEILMK